MSSKIEYKLSKAALPTFSQSIKELKLFFFLLKRLLALFQCGLVTPQRLNKNT